MKISYAALKKQNTIQEHWIKQILASFQYLRDSKQIHVYRWKYGEREEIILKHLLMGETKACLSLLIKENMKETIKTKLDRYLLEKLTKNKGKLRN